MQQESRTLYGIFCYFCALLRASPTMAGLTQSLRFTASFPWSPRHRECKHCQWQYKTKRERCLSKLNSFSFSFCTCGAACALFALVIPAGFEPTTHSLEGCCSIQLSYGTIVLSISEMPQRMRKSNIFFSIS